MLVGHVDAHQPERVLRTGVLAEPEVLGIRLPPIDGGGIDLRPVEGAGQHADALLLQIAGLLDEPRNEIEVRHAFGHAPVGEEIERPDGCAHGRCLPLRLADDHAMAQLHLVPLDRFELERGSVHEHIAIVQFLRQQIPEALLIDPELRQPRLRRNVQRLQRGPVHPAGDAQSVVLLEAPHGGFQAVGVVDAEQGLAGPPRHSPLVARRR